MNEFEVAKSIFTPTRPGADGMSTVPRFGTVKQANSDNPAVVTLDDGQDVTLRSQTPLYDGSRVSAIVRQVRPQQRVGHQHRNPESRAEDAGRAHELRRYVPEEARPAASRHKRRRHHDVVRQRRPHGQQRAGKRVERGREEAAHRGPVLRPQHQEDLPVERVGLGRDHRPRHPEGHGQRIERAGHGG